MKNVFKERIFYYIFIPAFLAIWPLLIWLVYLPRTENNWRSSEKIYSESKEFMRKILKVDPDRLDYATSKKSTEFDRNLIPDIVIQTLDEIFRKV